jgi:hypothetical protein
MRTASSPPVAASVSSSARRIERTLRAPRLEPWRIRLRAGEAMLRGEPVRTLDRCA